MTPSPQRSPPVCIENCGLNNVLLPSYSKPPPYCKCDATCVKLDQDTRCLRSEPSKLVSKYFSTVYISILSTHTHIQISHIHINIYFMLAGHKTYPVYYYFNFLDRNAAILLAHYSIWNPLPGFRTPSLPRSLITCLYIDRVQRACLHAKNSLFSW